MENKSTATRLSELLSITGDSQKELAEKTKTSKSAVSLYLSGRRIPHQDVLFRISQAYGIDPAWLMGFDVPMYSKLADQSNRFLKYAHLLETLTQDDLEFLDHQILYMSERNKHDDQ